MTHRTRRRLAFAFAVGLSLAALGACGDDSDDDVAPTDADRAGEEVAAPDEAAEDPFCEGFVGIEQALAEAPEDDAEMPAFVEERIQPNLALIEGNEPEGIVEEVQTMTAAVEDVASTGDVSVFETPEFSTASVTVYRSLDEACDANIVEFSGVDFAYEGIPSSLPPGLTSFVMSNDSVAGEAHEVSLVKLADGVELSIEELLAMPQDEAEQHIETFAGGMFAPPEATAGTVTELTPGRWAYVCFLPIGSVGDSEGSGPPHFTEGMAGEFTVN